MLFWYIVLFIGSGWILSECAALVLRGALSLAKRFRVKSFAVGFILLGLLTSTPEFFVSIQSVATGVPQFAIGGLIGGSIFLLSFVVGVSAIALGRIQLDRTMTFDEVVLGSAVVAAPALALWDGRLGRMDGIFMVGIYVLHLVVLNKEEHILSAIEHHPKHVGHWGWVLGKIVAGVAVMAVASRIIVNLAQLIIAALGIPAFLFGLFVLAVGVNLPELALAWQTIVLRRERIALGDFLGSGAANTLILGIICLVSPFTLVNHQQLFFSLILLVVVALFLVWSLRSHRDITRREGFGFLIFYLLFIAYELFGAR